MIQTRRQRTTVPDAFFMPSDLSCRLYSCRHLVSTPYVPHRLPVPARLTPTRRITATRLSSYRHLIASRPGSLRHLASDLLLDRHVNTSPTRLCPTVRIVSSQPDTSSLAYPRPTSRVSPWHIPPSPTCHVYSPLIRHLLPLLLLPMPTCQLQPAAATHQPTSTVQLVPLQLRSAHDRR